MEAAMRLVQTRPGARHELPRLRPRLRSAPPPRRDGDPPKRDLVRVFDDDPDLLSGLDPATTDLLRRRVVTPKLWVEAGTWTPMACPEHSPTTLGLLVLDGLIVRSVHLNGRNCPELIGAGDLLRPWDRDQEDAVAASVSWKALECTTMAVLDERFVTAVCRWPTIMSALLSRTVQRSRTLAFHLAIVHVRHARARLRMLLWHLADRWGRVTPRGVHLPHALTHKTLADLACMRRPTASTELQHLCRDGELERNCDGTWLLTGERPSITA